MANKLSYSQVSKYTMCGESYRLHYIKKIRPKFTTGALLFGSALDEGLGCLLTGKGNAYDEFIKKFTNAKVLDRVESIPKNQNIVYSNTDFDVDLLSQADRNALREIAGDEWEKRIQDIKNKKSGVGFKNLTSEEKSFYNYANWLSMVQKGALMLKTYENEIMPKLGKVHAVQKVVTLSNGDDKLVGFIDFIADYDGKKVIFDNKTSTFPYESDSVITSPQLSLYVHADGSTEYGGYVVLNKLVKKNRQKVCAKCGHDGSGGRHKSCNNEVDDKRCGGDWIETVRPEINYQIIVDKIPKRTEQIVIENIDKANEGIKAGVFTRNFNMCDNFYGGSCPYKPLCFKEKMDDLVDLEELRGKETI